GERNRGENVGVAVDRRRRLPDSSEPTSPVTIAISGSAGRLRPPVVPRPVAAESSEVPRVVFPAVLEPDFSAAPEADFSSALAFSAAFSAVVLRAGRFLAGAFFAGRASVDAASPAGASADAPSAGAFPAEIFSAGAFSAGVLSAGAFS